MERKATLARWQVRKMRLAGKAVPACLAKMPGCKLIHAIDCGGYVGEQLNLFTYKGGK